MIEERVNDIPKNVPKKAPSKDDTFMLGFGNCGVSVCAARMAQTDPKQNPHLHWVICESNRMHLDMKLRNKPKKSPIGRWFTTGRVTLIQLGDGLGAGGDPLEGKTMMVEKAQEVMTAIGDCQTTFLFGGGGGGTGSGAMPVMADMLEKAGKHPFCILTIPELRGESQTTRIAMITQGELLEICPLAAIRNEYTPRNLSKGEGWAETDKGGIIPVIQIFSCLTQRTGDVLDADRRDWYTGRKGGNYVFTNIYNASPGLHDMEKAVLNNPYLDRRIVEQGESIIGWQRGKWSGMESTKLKEYLFRAMRVKQRGILPWHKIGAEEDGVPAEEKSLGFVIFAKNPPSTKRTSSVQIPGAALLAPSLPSQSPVPSVLPVPHVPEDNHSSNGNGQVTVIQTATAPIKIKGIVRTRDRRGIPNDEQAELDATPAIEDEWRWVMRKDTFNKEEQLRARNVLREIAELNGGVTFFCSRLPEETSGEGVTFRESHLVTAGEALCSR